MHILYCLWLVPRSNQAARISEIITQLASHNNSPIFHPHVTLATALSEGENEEQAHQWFRMVTEKLNVEHHNPLTLKFGPPAMGETRHQCVFVEVQKGAGFEALQRQEMQIPHLLNVFDKNDHLQVT